MEEQLWTYPPGPGARRGVDLQGFRVKATDGSIGWVDEATDDVSPSFIVVDTGPWIFGKRVVIPTGVIQKIDLDARKVVLRITKDQVKGSPDFDGFDHRSDDFRNRIGAYYGPMP